jgi:amidase
MALRPPTHQELAAAGRHFGMHLTDSDLRSWQRIVTGALASYDAVAALYEQHVPRTPAGRTHTVPSQEDNPLGAWYVRTEIPGAEQGPLAGVRVAVKDNIAVAGVPMMNGSRTVEGYVPSTDATVVTRLLDAGATVAGKAVCESLCFSGASHTSDTGPVRNPWDTSRTTGGSSSGSAALVATGEVDMALGGDQGGSVRMPSGFCGIVGHKPTHGLVPYTGAFPIETTLDHLGPMTRTVADAARMLGVLAGYDDGKDPRQRPGVAPVDYTAELERGVDGLRVGVVAEGFAIQGLSDPELDRTVRASAQRLAEAGMVVEDVSVPWHRHGMDIWNVIATEGAAAQMIDGNAYGYNWKGLYDPELMAHYGRQRRERADDLSDTTKMVALTGRYTLDTTSGRYYAMAQNLARMLRQAYDDALARYDVLVMPTLPITATVLVPPGEAREVSITRALEMIVNTAPTDVSGHPATTVPAGLVAGLPAGLMIIGKHYEDATCLRVAKAVESLAGGFPLPPVAATAGSR